jgi:hypothetical protein
MKKINYLITFVLMAGTIGMFSSCKKILEQEPKNSTYDEVFWQTSRDCRSALAGNYSLLRDAVTDKSMRYYMYGDAIARNYFTIQYNGDGLEGIQGGDFTFTYNLSSLGDWTRYYKTIAMSNIILKKIPLVEESKLQDVDDATRFKNDILGQAYFIRALSYFMMARVWGEVSIVTEAYDDPLTAPQIARSPKAAVLKQVEDDCHAAAALLSWGYEQVGDAKVTANKGSVYALLAHLYLWRATMLDVSTDAVNMQDVNSADTTIDQIISKGGYTLTDTASYYSTFIGRSTEGIFEINMSENSLEGSSQAFGLQFLHDIPNYSSFGPGARYFVPPSYIASHYRLKIGEGPHWFWNGTEWVWIDITLPDVYDTDIRFRKNLDFIATDKPASIKYNNLIYRNPGQKRDPYLSNNIIVFRLADMMLLKAEIALYKNNPDAAIDIINFFRQRNGAYHKDPNDPDDVDAFLEHGMTKEDVMDEYMKERGKELFLEGHNFYDLLRTRSYKAGVGIDWLSESRFKKEGFYFPINPLLFRVNPQLRQTSYWLGRV